MAGDKMGEVTRQLRRIVLLRDGAGLTDGQLLDEYVSRRDEAAMEALVKRHSPMVWGVCRRLLRHSHDAEDAFQATFLVLVRKAASILPKALVGNWLYGVAHQTALNVRATAIRRSKRERRVTDMSEPEAPQGNLWHELQLLLDQELSRLPDKYRATIVLCDLEGKTRKEAARQLGVPPGTVAGQLARARTLLAKRLARHGLGTSGGALAAAVSQNAATACVPPLVVSSTIKAVSLVAAGKVASGVISAKVVALTDGVVKAMLLIKLKTMVGVSLVVCVIATGVGASFLSLEPKLANTGSRSAKPVATLEPQDNGPPKEFISKVGMKFVWIPPGTFMMGSPEGEEGRKEYETQHKVKLTKGFYMGVYTVTQEQWEALMGNNPSHFKGEKNLPVENVSWDECQVFLKKMGRSDGHVYRLPTEAEWEYACRAGSKGAYFYGDDPKEMDQYGWFRENSGDRTHPVGQKKPNAWGLYDMYGNVYQWCADWYAAYPETPNIVADPKVEKINFEDNRILRGGSFIFQASAFRSAHRARTPSPASGPRIGLRAVRDVDPEEVKLDTAPPKVIEPTPEQIDDAMKVFAPLLSGVRKPNLPGLVLYFVLGKNTNDAHLKKLPVVPFTFGLDLRSTQVTDMGLKEVANNHNLSGLDLSGAQVTAAGLRELASLKNLTSLDLIDAHMTVDCVRELANIKNLSSLYLRNTRVTDAGLNEFASLKKVSLLGFDGVQVGDTWLKQLASLKILSTLQLYNTQITDAGFIELTRIKDLASLDLMGLHVDLTDAGLKEIAKLKNLSLLRLDRSRVTNRGLKELASLKNLSRLFLNNTAVTDAGLRELANLHNLSALELMGTKVTDAGLKELVNLDNLSTLHLVSTQVTDVGLKELVKLKKLSMLSLSGINVTDMGLRELANLKSLSFLELHGTKVTKTGIREFHKVLPTCTVSGR